jgi:hypothetical protein
MENHFKLTLRVVWWMQVLQILFAFTFTILAIASLRSLNSSESLLTFFLFACFAYLCWANALSTIQITDESVTVTVFYGRFRISWNEIEKIVLNRPLIALIGNDKRVVLSLAFAGKNGQKMLDYFEQQIERRKIVFEQNAPFPITHQNARVWH